MRDFVDVDPRFAANQPFVTSGVYHCPRDFWTGDWLRIRRGSRPYPQLCMARRWLPSRLPRKRSRLSDRECKQGEQNDRHSVPNSHPRFSRSIVEHCLLQSRRPVLGSLNVSQRTMHHTVPSAVGCKRPLASTTRYLG